MTDSFSPDDAHATELRRAFGRFATGVTVVTAPSARGPLGITANSFASVSLDPPLILWCAAKSSARHDALAAAPYFALHVLAEAQDEIAGGFARRGDAFELCDWSLSARDVPLIEGCPARFECTLRDRIDAGDHTVLIGLVTRITLEPEIRPRVFLGGRWGGFEPTE